jgi:hypothetical protein
MTKKIVHMRGARRAVVLAVGLLLTVAVARSAESPVRGSAVVSGTPLAAMRAAAGADPKKVCTRYASPAGRDGAAGTAHHPFATVQRLVRALAPGQTGCLLRGLYVEDVTVRHGGTQGAPVTIRSAPGAVATIRGRLWIAQTAPWVTFTHLNLDGRNASSLPSPTINGDHVTFSYDDVTNYKMGGRDDGDGICFNIGDSTGVYGYAHYTLLTHNTIHDCGTSNNHNHGIYVAGSYNATIVRNWIWGNADRGIQLYPDAHETRIANNIIAGNGEGIIFSGDDTHASSDNLVTHNVIVDSRIRYNVEYYWPGRAGDHNVVADNCIFGGARGNLLRPEIGYAAMSNLIVAPRFTSTKQPAGIVAGSACASFAPNARATSR